MDWWQIFTKLFIIMFTNVFSHVFTFFNVFFIFIWTFITSMNSIIVIVISYLVNMMAVQVHTDDIQKQAETNLLQLICDTYQVALNCCIRFFHFVHSSLGAFQKMSHIFWPNLTLSLPSVTNCHTWLTPVSEICHIRNMSQATLPPP